MATKKKVKKSARPEEVFIAYGFSEYPGGEDPEVVTYQARSAVEALRGFKDSWGCDNPDDNVRAIGILRIRVPAKVNEVNESYDPELDPLNFVETDVIY